MIRQLIPFASIEEMVEKCGSIILEEELLNQILEFELNKAKDKDVASYSLEGVTGK